MKGGAISQNPPRPHIDGPICIESQFEDDLETVSLDVLIEEARLEMEDAPAPEIFRVEEQEECYRPARRYRKPVIAASAALFFVLGAAGESMAPVPPVEASRPLVKVEKVMPDFVTSPSVNFYDAGFILDLEPEVKPMPTKPEKESSADKKSIVV